MNKRELLHTLLGLGQGKKKSQNSHQGSQRLEQYLNIQDCLEKSLKIIFALKST